MLFRSKIIAWAAYSIGPVPALDFSRLLPPNAMACWLVDTCVATSERGRGLAGILMDQRLRHASAAGCCCAFGACADKNYRMVDTLDARGFKRIGASPFAGDAGSIYIKQFGE